jgi:hypothetical protein
MQQSDSKRFSEVMRYLALNFPERELSTPELMCSYFRDLSDFGIDEIEKAAKAYVRTGDKFPLVSDLIRGAIRGQAVY